MKFSRLKDLHTLSGQIVKLTFFRCVPHNFRVLLSGATVGCGYWQGLPLYCQPVAGAGRGGVQTLRVVVVELRSCICRKITQCILLNAKVVNLSGNLLADASSGTIYSATTINLSNNLISKVPEYQHNVNESLQVLVLSNNRLTSLNGIEKFVSLTTLYASDNLIEEFEQLHCISSLTSLQKLFLKGNPIEHSPNYRTCICSMVSRRVVACRKFTLDGLRLTANETSVLGSYVVSGYDKKGSSIVISCPRPSEIRSELSGTISKINNADSHQATASESKADEGGTNVLTSNIDSIDVSRENRVLSIDDRPSTEDPIRNIHEAAPLRGTKKLIKEDPTSSDTERSIGVDFGYSIPSNAYYKVERIDEGETAPFVKYILIMRHNLYEHNEDFELVDHIDLRKLKKYSLRHLVLKLIIQTGHPQFQTRRYNLLVDVIQLMEISHYLKCYNSLFEMKHKVNELNVFKLCTMGGCPCKAGDSYCKFCMSTFGVETTLHSVRNSKEASRFVTLRRPLELDKGVDMSNLLKIASTRHMHIHMQNHLSESFSIKAESFLCYLHCFFFDENRKYSPAVLLLTQTAIHFCHIVDHRAVLRLKSAIERKRVIFLQRIQKIIIEEVAQSFVILEEERKLRFVTADLKLTEDYIQYIQELPVIKKRAKRLELLRVVVHNSPRLIPILKSLRSTVNHPETDESEIPSYVGIPRFLFPMLYRIVWLFNSVLGRFMMTGLIASSRNIFLFTEDPTLPAQSGPSVTPIKAQLFDNIAAIKTYKNAPNCTELTFRRFNFYSEDKTVSERKKSTVDRWLLMFKSRRACLSFLVVIKEVLRYLSERYFLTTSDRMHSDLVAASKECMWSPQE